MKEDFLHYLWKFQKLSGNKFFTTAGERLYICHPGLHNMDSGPDFFNAQLELDGQLWAGNVEIHINSSDWFAHRHETDPAYDNVILHVVWKHDTEVFRKDGTIIPTFILKNHLDQRTLEQYQKLFSKPGKWINCENDLPFVDAFLIEGWLERLYFERLERKEVILLEELDHSKNHWEALLFRMLSRNFGLKVNGESFFSLARSIDFSIIQKNKDKQFNLESLLFGQAGFLDEEPKDDYHLRLKENYFYLKHKFSLENNMVISPKYFRLRPPNFPTIRLSQLASLYSNRENLFSEVISRKSLKDLYELFDVQTSEYWKTHYNFGVSSSKRTKSLTRSFIDLLIINTVLPVKFSYSKYQSREVPEEIWEIARQIHPEENSIVTRFNKIRKMAENAFQSQALLELKNEYCDKNKCVQCTIGNSIIGS